MKSLKPFFDHITNHQIAMRQVIDLHTNISLALKLINDTTSENKNIYTYGDSKSKFIAHQLVFEGCAQLYDKDTTIDDGGILIYYNNNGKVDDFIKPENCKIISINGNTFSDNADVYISVKNNDKKVVSEIHHMINNIILCFLEFSND